MSDGSQATDRSLESNSRCYLRMVIVEGEISSTEQRINSNDHWVGNSSLTCLA